MNNKKLIFIDDDSLSNNLHQLICKKTIPHYEVVTFDDPALAAEHLLTADGNTDFKEAIVFLDINMPIYNGWWVLKKLAEKFTAQNNPYLIFMLSSSIDERDLQQARENPLVSEYHYKPFEIEILLKIIQTYEG